MTCIIRLIPSISITWRLRFIDTEMDTKAGKAEDKKLHVEIRLIFFKWEQYKKIPRTEQKRNIKISYYRNLNLAFGLMNMTIYSQILIQALILTELCLNDFLHEIRKRIHESDTGKIQLKLLLPESKRNKERETVIVRHLHSHFKYEAIEFAEHKKKMQNRGWLSTLAGLIIMMFAAWFVYNSAKHFSISMLRVITEPAGWFLV